MIDFLRFLPPFWYQQRKTCMAWDRALNRALDMGITAVGRYDAQVGPFEVWTSNYPYAFGYNCTDALEVIPRVWTRLRLRRAIQEFNACRYEEMLK